MKKIKVAHYGINGHSIFKDLCKTEKAQMTAVSGITEESYKALKEREDISQAFSDSVYYPDFKTMLDKGNPDLVVFCSPRRYEQNTLIEEALLAGKHVLAEKPLVTDMSSLNHLKEVQKKTGKEVLAMLPLVYSPVIRKMRKLVDSGNLGKIVQVYGLKSYPYRNSRPQDRGVDGGIIQSAIHAVSFIRMATGLEFTEVFAQDTDTGNPERGNLQMGMNITCKLSNGALACILANYCNPPNFGTHGNDQIRIFGTQTMIEAVDGFKRVSIADGKEPLHQIEVDEIPVSYPLDYIDYLLGGPQPLLTMEDSFKCTEIVLRAQESANKGKPVLC